MATTQLRHQVEDAAVGAVAALTRWLPKWIVFRLGDALGLVFYAIDPKHRRLTEANLVVAFPHRERRELRRVARQVFMHFGRLLVEILRFSGLSPDEMRAEVEFEGVEHAHRAYEAGKGAIFITGHFGFWEIHAIAYGLERPISVVARALDNPLLHARLERVRTCTGNSVIYRQGGLRRILRALGSNQGVAILIDQHMQGTEGVAVDFFGRPAATTTAVATLALRTGAPVIPVFALPLPDGRYRLICEHPVEPPPTDSPDAILDFTQRCTDVLEMYVRRYPHLWLWMHRRWRDVAPAAPGMFPRADRMDGEDES